MIRLPALMGWSVNKPNPVTVRLTAKLREIMVIRVCVTSAGAQGFRAYPFVHLSISHRDLDIGLVHAVRGIGQFEVRAHRLVNLRAAR